MNRPLLICGFLTLAGVAALGDSVPKAAPSLLKKSIRIVNLKSLPHDSGADFQEPLWLSNHRALAHNNVGDGYFSQAYVLDILTHIVVRQPRLSAQIIGYKVGDWTLSSDRRWVLWRQKVSLHEHHMVATRVDGAKSIRWTMKMYPNGCSFYWLTGSHRWVYLRSLDGNHISEARLYDLDERKPTRIMALKPIAETQLLGQLPNGGILPTLWYDAYKTGRLPLTEIRITRSGAEYEHRTLKLPDRGEVFAVYLSPNGKRLAFTVTAGQSDKPGNGLSESLWACNVDGTQMRAIGRIGDPISLHGWLPSSNALLYDYKGSLYTVSTK